MNSLAVELAARPQKEINAFLSKLTDDQMSALKHDWSFWGRPTQQRPPGTWYIWLMCTGRGWGKNRSFSEWCHYKADEMPGSHGGVVARTVGDVRDTVVLEESGILNTQKPWNPVTYTPSNRLLQWANGSTALTFSSEEPAQLRGPNLNWAAGDEWATWKRVKDKLGGTAWENLQFCCRRRGPAGESPQIVLTTTPRPTAEMRGLIKDPRVVVTVGSMLENKLNLAPEFIDAIRSKFEGTRLGRQEIEGMVLDAVENAIVTQEMIDDARLDRVPHDVQLLTGGVGVDPAGSVNKDSDLTGLMPAKKGSDGHLYVFPPRSGKLSPLQWARRAIELVHKLDLDFIVAERNNGGDMVKHTIAMEDHTMPIKTVFASRGKHVRFEPLGLLYEQGRVHHVGPPSAFSRLENQVCAFTEEGYLGDDSPDDADALVWICAQLMPRKGMTWGGLYGEREVASA